MDRFWAKVVRTPTCWLWVGAVGQKGYGVFQIDGTAKSAHRVAYELHNKQAPTGHVMHTCDNPLCVRPDHLVDGDAYANMRDKVSKGRARGGKKQMTWDIIHAMRSDSQSGMRNCDISAKYDIERSMVSRIVNHRVWKEVH